MKVGDIVEIPLNLIDKFSQEYQQDTITCLIVAIHDAQNIALIKLDDITNNCHVSGGKVEVTWAHIDLTTINGNNLAIHMQV